jgi:hypothetical protein
MEIETIIVSQKSGKRWFLTREKAKNGVLLYKGKCQDCKGEMVSQKQTIKLHSNRCRPCNGKLARKVWSNNAENRIKTRNRQERKLEADKRRLKRKRTTVKAKGLGTLIIEFDNQLDNSVKAFNEKFNEYLGDDPNLTVEILEMYTHNGRRLKIGDKIVNHLFFDEADCMELEYYIDLYHKDTKDFIKRYKSAHTVARDIDSHANVIMSAINERHNSLLNYIFKKVDRK